MEGQGFLPLVEPRLFWNTIIMLGGGFNINLTHSLDYDLARMVTDFFLKDAAGVAPLVAT